MKKILHLSHTDIQSDSRILKEMGSLSIIGYLVCGIGVRMKEGGVRSTIDFEADIKSIQLWSRRLIFLPRPLRHVISLLELMGKMLPGAIKNKPDVVHCHDTLVLPLGVIVKLISGARLVYDAHELESNRNGLSRILGRLTLWTEKLLWQFVDSLIVVSPSIKAWYIKNVGAKPTAVIMNSPLFDAHRSIEFKDDYLRSKFNIPNNSRIFIYVGILGLGRGLDLVIDAFTKLGTQSHIVFLGYGELEAELKKLTAKYPNFHFHGAVPHAQVVSIVRSADFGLCLVQNVSLSDYYCLPNKLFEYCFARVPVLASNFPDISALINQHNLGVCCELDSSSVHRAVKLLSQNKVEFKFTNLSSLGWQAQEQKLKLLYEQLLKS
jgi:glycosyltransferase involved in cell wall biosynthesis